MIACPNKSSPAWTSLVSTIGENETWKTWIRNKGEYPSPLEAAYQMYLEESKDNAISTLWLNLAIKNDLGLVNRQMGTLDLIRMADTTLFEDKNFLRWTTEKNLAKPLGLVPVKPLEKSLTIELAGTMDVINDINRTWPDPTPYYISMDYSSLKQDRALEIASKIADRFASQLSIAYEILDSTQADKLLAKTETPYRGQAGFFFSGKVYLVKDKITPEIVVHEFSHPFIKAISLDNKPLFESLYIQLTQSQEGLDTIDKVKVLYPNLDIESDRFKEEVIVHGLEDSATKNMLDQTTSQGFKKFVQNLLYSIKQILRKLFGKSVKVSDLSPTTTLEELSQMLTSKDFVIDTQAVTNQDIAEFKESAEKYMKDLKALQDSNKTMKTLNTAYEIASSQMRWVMNNPKAFSKIREILAGEYKSGILRDIKDQLSAFQDVEVFNQEAFDLRRRMFDYKQQQATALVGSIIGLKDFSVRVFEDLSRIARESGDPSKETIGDVIYYNKLLDSWGKFINEMKEDMRKAAIPATSELSNLINNIDGVLGQAKATSSELYTRFSGGFFEKAVEQMNNQVEERYQRRKKELEKKNAPKSEVQENEEFYKKFHLSRQKLEDILTGKSGETSWEQKTKWLNGIAESFTLSTSPIVGTFATFLKDSYTDFETSVQKKSNKFMSELRPLLEDAGYNPDRLENFWSQVLFKDTVAIRNDKGELEKKEVWAFLNQWKDYRYDLSVAEQDLEEAKESQDPEAVSTALEKLSSLKRYFHQPYSSELYQMEDKYKKTPLGVEAFHEASIVLAKIRERTNTSIPEIEQYTGFDEVNELWRDYLQLSSLTDIDGNQKTGRDLEKARLLKSYRQESSKFYEWKPKEGAFEKALDTFEEQLEAAGTARGTADFNQNVQDWIKKNTRVVYDQAWYEERADKFAKIKEITAKLDQKLQSQIDISSGWEEILDTTAGYRDSEGQPVASDMGDKRIARIKRIQQDIVDAQAKFAGMSGLTVEEMDRLNFYFDKRRQNLWLTEQEQEDFNDLSSKKIIQGLDQFEKIELFKLYAELKELQVKEPTDYYLDRVNYWMRELEQATVDKVSADNLLKSEVIRPLLSKDDKFRTWFEANHVRKETFDKETRTKKEVWERVYVWNVIKPRDPKYIKTTTLKKIDPTTGNPMIIQGEPTRRFQYRTVKSQYRTKRIVGETIDNRGKWLPKTVVQDAPDSRYVNEEYFKLQRDNPKLFKLLKVITKHHLEFQENSPSNSRLWLDLPRYRKDNLEYLQSGGAAKTGNALKTWVKGIRDSFAKSKDDYDQGLNFEPDQQFTLVRADVFGEEIQRIPITGLYNMDIDQTSLDVLFGMHRYLYSAERQKKLLEIDPIAQAIKQTLNNPDHAIKDLTKVSRFSFVKRGEMKHLPLKGKKNIMAQQFNSLYDREFLGQQVAGDFQASSELNKFANFLMKGASMSFLALKIPSAVVNTFGGVFQNIIETAGGQYVNPVSLAKGSTTATQAMMSVSSEIYKRGPKSLLSQMIDIFDAVQGRFETDFGRSSSRTVLRDTASLSWMMSPREFGQMGSQLQLFFGMMHNVFVDQVLPDGTTKKLEYADAWEMQEGQIKLKEGIDKSWDTDGENFKMWKRRMQERANQLYGTYAKFDQADGNRYLLWRFVTFLRKYFVSMVMSRFGVERYNWGMTDVQRGFYTEAGLSMIKTIRTLGQHVKYMSAGEKIAFRKLTAEMMQITLLTMLGGLLFGYDDDDKERYEKLRAKSGPLGSENFELAGWLSNQALYTMMKTRDENSSFIPWPGMGLDDYMQYKNVTSIAFGPTVDAWATIAQDLWQISLGDESAYYKRDVGPYTWQKEESAKLWNHVGKMLGMTGTSVDPVLAIKNFETMKSKIK